MDRVKEKIIKLPRLIFTLPIRFYKKFISPCKMPCCKYYPSCSTYTLTAIERFGALRGCALGAWRLLRCNPWSLGGIDPVPEKITFGMKRKEEGENPSL